MAELGEKYWELIEPVWGTINLESPQVFLEQFRKIRIEQQHLFAAHWCQSEVCNGGFHQFFYNSTGILAPEAAIGFSAIGLEDCSEIIEEAMAFFGAIYPREQEQRIEFLIRLQNSLGDEVEIFQNLDERFYRGLGFRNGRFLKAADEYAQNVLIEG